MSLLQYDPVSRCHFQFLPVHYMSSFLLAGLFQHCDCLLPTYNFSAAHFPDLMMWFHQGQSKVVMKRKKEKEKKKRKEHNTVL